MEFHHDRNIFIWHMIMAYHGISPAILAKNMVLTYSTSILGSSAKNSHWFIIQLGKWPSGDEQFAMERSTHFL